MYSCVALDIFQVDLEDEKTVPASEALQLWLPRGSYKQQRPLPPSQDKRILRLLYRISRLLSLLRKAFCCSTCSGLVGITNTITTRYFAEFKKSSYRKISTHIWWILDNKWAEFCREITQLELWNDIQVCIIIFCIVHRPRLRIVSRVRSQQLLISITQLQLDPTFVCATEAPSADVYYWSPSTGAGLVADAVGFGSVVDDIVSFSAFRGRDPLFPSGQ